MSSEFIAGPSSPVATGYFGKVPSHGDFVTRRLPPDFIGVWDHWLQEAITNSRQQLGEEWLKHYLTSPIYRFALSSGICGDGSWLGLLMPSVDRVNRYFPMTLSIPVSPRTNPFLAMHRQDEWFRRAEALAMSCLQDDFDLKRFDDDISRLSIESSPAPVDDDQALVSTPEQPFNHAWCRQMETVDAIADRLPDLIDDLLKEFCFAYSVWWTHGSEQVAPSLLVCEGLPPFQGLAAFFDGNWQQWGWEGRRFPLLPSTHAATAPDLE